MSHFRSLPIGLGALSLLSLSLAASAQDTPEIETKIVIDSHTTSIQTPIGSLEVGKIVLNGRTYFHIGPMFGLDSAKPNSVVPPFQFPLAKTNTETNTEPLKPTIDPKTGQVCFGIGPRF